MKYIDLARKVARKSKTRYKVSAIGFNHKGELLGTAFSSFRFSKYGGGLHAEMALLHRYGSNVKTIMICRVGNTGEILPIDPCRNCKKILDKMGIKIVIIKKG